MISVIVTYKVKANFVQQNKINIQKFITDFDDLDKTKFQYNVFVKNDGLTFVHHSIYKDENSQSQLLSMPSFLAFQKERDEIGLDGEPEISTLNLLASSGEF